MKEQQHWQEGMQTHENIIFSCFGGLSNRKIVERAGFNVTRSIVLVRDIGMKKKGLHEGIGSDLKGVMEYISADEVKKAKDLIVKTVFNAGTII